ncbi:ABC transporter substrate-binding protein [Camelimonas lactis]|uniref:ABC-type branched-subunit amino acid transport system substrate-binding protein n=1 Tax=Camelimonas lactis TaxID=659006 RepID=A0A4V2RX82_9HYPH|nr:ABC transporter substrate-binding protein [Camelimonas lactis]TCO12390.1 ABC-type branched-subunit amino acid transport system substrate-binding protein [Camelimonas lactis]
MIRRLVAATLATVALCFPAISAEKKYDQGASDTEIRLGQTMPYSGPASYVGIVGRTQTAYFRMINAQGGINGRKVTLISLDDAYNPAKTVEATRRLVEGDGVLATMSSNGTVTQAAVQKYLNSKGIPQLMIGSGSSRWSDPQHFPWSTGALSLYVTEGKIFGRWILKNRPDAKIGVLAQNDDLGRDFIKGLREGLGEKASKLIVSEQMYDLTEPTVDSQILTLSRSGANVFFNASTGKFVTQSIRKVKELNWPALHYLMSASATRMLLEGAGLQNAKGLMTVQSVKHVASPKWKNDPDVKTYEAFRAKWSPDTPADDDVGFYAYSSALLMKRILEACGDNLTRANVLKHATNLKGQTSPILLPGITLNISPDDYAPVTKFYMGVFNGDDWEVSGDLVQ